MRSGLSIGRVFGIRIVIDVSWFVIAALVTFALAASFSEVAQGPGVWLVAGFASAAFFGSVLVHELSHSLVARRRGIPVRQIRLFVFGGVSELEHEATSPSDEFAVTIAGPLSSLVLGALLFGAGRMLGDSSQLIRAAVGWLASVNVILAVFNLLPGFPLDGGRVLRAAVWKRTGDRRKATRIAARAGQVIALLMVGGGFLITIYVGLDGLWLALVGWFLYGTASSVGAMPHVDPRARSLLVEDVMEPVRGYVGAATTLLAITPDASRYTPVLDPWGVPRGIISQERVFEVPPSSWAETRVGDVMRRLGPGQVVQSGQPVERILGAVRGRPWLVLVMDGDVPAGIITADTIDSAVDRSATATS